ncbi:aspartate aminotransferase family protein [Halobacillus sp. Marseille-Q1614]|uniref:aspartate aminotransferase family protein n=1 Tax=Halobacillus sp. Marseille-Q1614 TaxID=2709134 RepID=UPI001570312D|nr:aspartate aminotransferase family protein [Halobacillus sp. Marseille-Q1614]
MNKVKTWIERDHDNIMHGMTPFRKNPLIAKSAKGCFVEDTDQNKYLDAMSGLWCVNVGYGREVLAEAAHNQMVEMSYYPLVHSHKPAIELAEKLNSWLDDEYVFFFSNSGSEANEAAFKVARQYFHQKGESERYKVLSRYRAYHGGTLGALAATGQAQRKYKYEPLAAGFIHTVPPDCYHCPLGKQPTTCNHECADMVEQTMTWELDETVAAVIMEPYITGGGVFVPPEGYLKKVRDICDRHGVLLIIDEVISGFGRTGEKFGFQHEGISPDIITMAKGVTSGYLPLSATAVRKDIYDAFKEEGDYNHFRTVNTFGGNPSACALALKNIEIIEEENLVKNSRIRGKQLIDELAELKSHPHVGDIRSKGLVIGIELVKDQSSRIPLEEERINKVITRCKELGVIIGKNGDTVAGFNNVLTIAPPLIIDEGTVRFLSGAIKRAIQDSCF